MGSLRRAASTSARLQRLRAGVAGADVAFSGVNSFVSFASSAHDSTLSGYGREHEGEKP